MEFTDRCTKAFAELNGLAPTDRQFTFKRPASWPSSTEKGAREPWSGTCYVGHQAEGGSGQRRRADPCSSNLPTPDEQIAAGQANTELA